MWVCAGLVCVGGEKCAVGFVDGNSETLLASPPGHVGGVRGEDGGGFRDPHSSCRRGEVVSVGGNEGCCVGVIGDEVIEEGGGEDRALWDTCVDWSEGREGVVVAASGCPAFEVAGQPADDVRVEGGGGYLGEELGVRDGVKGLREIYKLL